MMEAADEVAEAWIEAVMIRADGTVEDLGVLAHYKRDEEEGE